MAQDKASILLKSGTNEVEFIEFYLAGTSYGINVAKVKHVASLSEVNVTPQPESMTNVEGVIYFHNKPVNLINLGGALRITPKEDDEKSTRLVLMAEFNNRQCGFLIDGIHKIHRTSWDNFRPFEDVSRISTGAGYITGSVIIEERIILILDMERLMLDFGDCWAGPDDELPEEQVATDRVSRRAALRVVYAEDSAMIRKVTEKVMRKSGIEKINVFPNGKEALAHLEKVRAEARAQGKSLADQVDLVLTDIEMPEMDGLTLCRTINEVEDRNPPVLIYSSLINKEMVTKCQSVGAADQISKPSSDTVIQAIDRVCLGAEAASPA